MLKAAIVADVHLHDLYGGYGLRERSSGALALRAFADTAASTRVFNESYPAFLAILEDIVRRGISTVVLLGDYSDDGQPGAVAALKRILSDYETNHGLRFFTVFGNHDCFGPVPRHQSKWLTAGGGGASVLASSDPGAPEPAVFAPEMLGMSTAGAMQAMASYGIARPAGVLHWETPFGTRDALDERYPEGGDPALPDASYLVEPQEGLWLLMLDANVFHRAGAGWKLKADAAWDHVLTDRPYLIDWIRDAAQRAKHQGKTLLACSHYPVLPLTLEDTGSGVRAAGTPSWLERMPSANTGQTLAAAGLEWHFSGHMHTAGEVKLDGLVNVAVPSPVAFPAGYCVVEASHGSVHVETVSLGHVPGFDVAFSAYADEIRRGHLTGSHGMTGSGTYADFLLAHLRQLVATRHVPADWPRLLPCLEQPIGHLLPSGGPFEGLFTRRPDMALLPLRSVLEDYYVLRACGGGAPDAIDQTRTEFYRGLSKALSGGLRQSNDSILDEYLFEVISKNLI
ncbi:metallophosphoesterase family protein [Pannonibacter phragmitetus]|uniref:metallophosphoesterase family protein n=1 Tax=Pannonibacter phragmitetus TaxID=121719 RepID=UPI000F0140BC|nr:metallophosphoesterase [Pannonibacter phragmitetus]